jgi:DNA-binding IclR family transcriptional regulator
MERQSPPTDRVMRVLGLFASVAPERLGLSAVARALGLSQSTCLGILNELTRGGFLVRHAPGPTYSLGAALMLLGQAAQASLPGLEPASAEAAVLADELGAVITVSAVIGREIVVLDRHGVSSGSEPFIDAGARFPFHAPIGVMFAAWQDDATVDDWLARAPVELPRAQVTRIGKVVRACRADGYLVERLTEAEQQLHRFLPGLGQRDGDERVARALAHAVLVFAQRDYLSSELRRGERCSVSVISAPCFGPAATPDVLLSLYVMQPDIEVDRVLDVAAELRRAAARVTADVGGRNPWHTEPRPARTTSRRAAG